MASALWVVGADATEHVTAEFRVACADGSYRWVEETVSNLTGEPAVNGLVGTIRDIADRRAAEEALRRRNRLTNAVAAKAADTALVVGADGRVSYHNRSASSVLTATEGETVDFGRLSTVHPDDRDAVRARLIGLGGPGASVETTFRTLGVDGSWRWVEKIITNCVDDPDVSGYVINLRDVTERVEAEQALRASEARYRLIAETAQEGIWATDPDGRTLYANQKMADLLGRPLADGTPTAASTSPPRAAAPFSRPGRGT